MSWKSGKTSTRSCGLGSDCSRSNAANASPAARAACMTTLTIHSETASETTLGQRRLENREQKGETVCMEQPDSSNQTRSAPTSRGTTVSFRAATRTRNQVQLPLAHLDVHLHPLQNKEFFKTFGNNDDIKEQRRQYVHFALNVRTASSARMTSRTVSSHRPAARTSSRARRRPRHLH